MKRVEEILQYDFKNKELMESALTHKSFHFEARQSSKGHNEKLEFLGDAVLDLALSELLMEQFPGDSEGNLSKKRASLVNETVLAQVAQGLGLSEFLRLGKGEQLTGGDKKPRLLASAYEALLGALFLDAGFAPVREKIRIHFQSLLASMDPHQDFMSDFKTRLQEVVQGEKREAPVYKLVAEKGPSHDRVFEVEVYIQDLLMGSGAGKSKKQAEQEAAKKVLEFFVSQGKVS